MHLPISPVSQTEDTLRNLESSSIKQLIITSLGISIKSIDACMSYRNMTELTNYGA